MKNFPTTSEIGDVIRLSHTTVALLELVTIEEVIVDEIVMDDPEYDWNIYDKVVYLDGQVVKSAKVTELLITLKELADRLDD